MPRKPIDYSNTIVYKLCCNDLQITDIYIGHTTDFKSRKATHKNGCNNSNNKAYNYNVYQFIRANGGWDNWSMVEIEKYCCKDADEARSKERHHYEILGGTLNIQLPNLSHNESNKLYRKRNSDNIKQYREANKEKMKSYYKDYKRKYRED